MLKIEEYLKISFEVSSVPSSVLSYTKAQKNMEIVIDENGISCAFYYDKKEQPLVLRSFCDSGDFIEIRLTDCRIELYVNGELSDEEWPIGHCCFSANEKIEGDFKCEVAECSFEETPFVREFFLGGEGWKPKGEVFVGDCMPHVNGKEYHVLYLKDRHHHKSKWGLGGHQWSHISTEDFKTWKTHPLAVPITKQCEGSICTGSHIEKDGKHYLFYTVRMADGSPAPISRSISTDGDFFEKDETFGFFLSERYDRRDARDPKVFLGADGLYHMLVTTKLTVEEKGCLVHLTSADFEAWTELAEPILITDDERQPECPDYIFYDGYYYLIYSLSGRAYYLKSSRPFDGFEVPTDAQIPCGYVPKGAVFDGKIIFTGFKKQEGTHGYAGFMTFRTAHADQNGWLVFEDQE